MDTKICSKCKEKKPVEEFYRKSSARDRLQTRCKACCNLVNKALYQQKKSKYREAHKKWVATNKSQYDLSVLEWRKRNTDYLKQQSHEYYEANKDHIKDRTKKYRQQHREFYKEYQREYMNAYYKERSSHDINFKLASQLRKRLATALAGKGKSGSAVKDLGCTIEELKVYLESKFQPGMTWDNRNKWHIDHIIPLASFDLTNEEQLKKACHYTNLQPLWAEDNLKKRNKIL